MSLFGRKLYRAADRLSGRRTIRAISNGFLFMIPFILISAFANILLYFPWPVRLDVLAHPVLQSLMKVLQMIGGSAHYFSLLLALSIGWNFARVWQTNALQRFLLAVLSAFCFLILIGSGTTDFVESYAAGEGVFTSIFAAVSASHCYLFVLSKIKRLRFILRPAIHYNLQELLYSVVPLTVVLIACAGVQLFVLQLSHGVLLQEFFARQSTSFILFFSFSPVLAATAYTLLVQLLWFVGVHGQHFLYAIQNDYCGQFFLLHTAAFGQTDLSIHILDAAVTGNCLMMGGAGSALALLLAVFCLSTNPTTRMLAKIAVLPTSFNIGEVLLFGLPVIWNPILLLPFLLVPLLNLWCCIAAFGSGIVPLANHAVFWAAPPVLNGYLATGSWRGAALQVVLLFLDFILYAPFVKLNDHRQNHSLQAALKKLRQTYMHLELIKAPLRLTELSLEQRNAADMLIRALLRDIPTDRVYLVYQPQFDTEGHFLGAEALLRWRYDEENNIYPPLIIALAKTGGFLHVLEKKIFREACQMTAILEEFSLDDFEISVNITGQSLQDPALAESLSECVQESGIMAEHLWLEVTEQDALESSQTVIARLQHLKLQGHHLLIDDFGMGSTSLIYLRSNLFDVIKLDGSITRNILDNQNNRQIVSTLTSLSRQMHLRVVAEFVETSRQRDKLAELGCDAFQGYLYSKPLNAFEFVDLLDRGSLRKIQVENCYDL